MNVLPRVTKDSWTLQSATEAEIEELMAWFPTADDVEIWGGPSFRYPFTRETFFEDIHWGRMVSYSLLGADGDLAAFGQMYERDERVHFARLVVHPGMRGMGVGKRLIRMLMAAGGEQFPCDECSLFVFRDNRPAYECYRSLGFAVREYPADMPHADVCYYLTRPLRLDL